MILLEAFWSQAGLITTVLCSWALTAILFLIKGSLIYHAFDLTIFLMFFTPVPHSPP